MLAGTQGKKFQNSSGRTQNSGNDICKRTSVVLSHLEAVTPQKSTQKSFETAALVHSFLKELFSVILSATATSNLSVGP